MDLHFQAFSAGSETVSTMLGLIFAPKNPSKQWLLKSSIYSPCCVNYWLNQKIYNYLGMNETTYMFKASLLSCAINKKLWHTHKKSHFTAWKNSNFQISCNFFFLSVFLSWSYEDLKFSTIISHVNWTRQHTLRFACTFITPVQVKIQIFVFIPVGCTGVNTKLRSCFIYKVRLTHAGTPDKW